MWRCIRSITDCKHSNQQVSCDPTLPDTLNSFFALFDSSSSRETVSPSAGGAELSSHPQWCLDNNLILNTSKIKEFIMDCRISRKTEQTPLLVYGEGVERVDNVKFLGLHLT